jgi:hypothetical protein
MKHIGLSTMLIACAFTLNAQTEGRLSVEINSGINGNFFVRDYDETGGPVPKTYFFKKKFIGTVNGIEAKYALNQRSRLGISYSRSVNKRIINFNETIDGVNLTIAEFPIRHTNHFYQLLYERQLTKKAPGISYHAGLFYLRMNQQEIEVANYANSILLEERNFKNGKLEEGGVCTGIQYSKFIDTKFELGIKTRVYFLLSTSTFEAITLTPTLTYHFSRK